MKLFGRKKDRDEKKQPCDNVAADVRDAKKSDKAAPAKSSARSVKAKAAPNKASGEKKSSMKDLYQGGGRDTGKLVGKKEKAIRQYGNAYKVLIKPLVTEKAASVGAENKYVFEVYVGSNKIEIADAIREVYGIKPLSVNISNSQGKNVRYGRVTGKRKNWKKAVITLPKGKTINIYEGV